MDQNSDAKALGAQKKSSKIWSVARICIAILAVVVILNLIQYDDMLAKDDLKFEILEVTESHYRITDADDNTLIVARPLTDSEYKFSPGAITVFKNMSVAPAVYAMLVFAAVPVLMAVRWQILLKAQQIDAPFLLVFKLTYAGIIMNFFLVGTTGGDVVKAFWLSQIKGKRAEVPSF